MYLCGGFIVLFGLPGSLLTTFCVTSCSGCTSPPISVPSSVSVACCRSPLHHLFVPCWFHLVFLWHCSDCSLLGTWHADVCGFSSTSFHLVFSLHMSVVSWSHLLLLLVATCYSLACMLHHLSPILTRVLLLYHDTIFEWSAFHLCALHYL